MKTYSYQKLLQSLDTKTLKILHADIQNKAHCGLCRNCKYNVIEIPNHLPAQLNGCFYHDVGQILQERAEDGIGK